MQYRRKLLRAGVCLGGLLWSAGFAVAQAPLGAGGDPHVRWAAPAAQVVSATERFVHCDLARKVGEAVIAPQRVKDWIDASFFAPVRSIESLAARLPTLSVRDDLQVWLRDARIEQQAVVRLLRGTPPHARPAGVDLWRIPIRLSHVARIARDDDGELPLERRDFVEFLAQADQRGGLDSLGRQMLVATLARVVRLNAQQREQCHLNACELRVLVKTGSTSNGSEKESWLADTQLWLHRATGATRISVPNLSSDGDEMPNAVDNYLDEQAKTLTCVVPAAFRR